MLHIIFGAHFHWRKVFKTQKVKSFKDGKLVVIVIGKKQDKNEFVDLVMVSDKKQAVKLFDWAGGLETVGLTVNTKYK